MVVRMRQAGLKETGVNAACRALNCYLKWSKNTGHIHKLREPAFRPPTFTASQIQAILKFKPTTYSERRTHLWLLIALDTGARLSEITSLHVHSIDLDNMLLTLMGKGRKQRVIPFSMELRRHIYKFITDENRQPFEFLLGGGTQVARIAVLRQVKRLCLRLGFEPPARTCHATRSTMATEYIRRGGNALLLQRILGHSTLTMTSRYVAMQTQDLSAAHEKLSMLST